MNHLVLVIAYLTLSMVHIPPHGFEAVASVTVLVVPVGFSDLTILGDSIDRAASAFEGVADVRFLVSIEPVTLPASLIDIDRMQYRADQVNRYMHELFRDYIDPGRRMVVAVVGGDGYASGLNFVFGLATPSLGTASVYTARLHGDTPRLVERIAKEVVHEVGHLLGLEHCRNRRCVMSFSNTIEDVDGKDIGFCSSCRAKLARLVG